MINRYGAHVSASLERRKSIRMPLTTPIQGYAIYERVGYQGKRIASTSTRETAQVIVDILTEAHIGAWLEEY